VSWNSSTLNHRFRARTVDAASASFERRSIVPVRRSSKVDPPGACLRALVVAYGPDEEVGRDRRLSRRGRGGPLIVGRPDPPALRPLDLVREVLRRA
jgi:hypothetical protein